MRREVVSSKNIISYHYHRAAPQPRVTLSGCMPVNHVLIKDNERKE